MRRTRRRYPVCVGPESLTVQILANLAAEVAVQGDPRDAARLRLVAAIVANCPNAANLEAAGRAIHGAREALSRPKRLVALVALPPNRDEGD